MLVINILLVLQAQSGIEDDSFYQSKDLSASVTYVPNLDWPIHSNEVGDEKTLISYRYTSLLTHIHFLHS